MAWNKWPKALQALWALPLLLPLFAAGCSSQSDYPNRPIFLICPWAAGGGTDRISRQIAVQLEKELGVPVNVLNATGGGGVTGHSRGAFARPDGYTLTMITPELNMLHWRGLTNITFKDFQPLMMVNRDGAAIFVPNSDKWKNKTLKDLTNEIRANPGKLEASGTAFGGIWHLSLAGWLHQEKINPADVRWVASKGSNPSLLELQAGGVDMVCCSIPEADSLLEAKAIRCLGIMAPQRLAGREEIPTFEQQGVNWSHVGWRGIAVPKGVASERVAQLEKSLQKVVASEEYLSFLKKGKFGAAALPTEEFAKFLEKDDKQYQEWLTAPEYQSLREQPMHPMVFPAILGCLLILAIGALAVIRPGQTNEEIPPITRDGLLRMGAATGWVIAYLAAMAFFGFVVSGVVLLALLLRLLKAGWVTVIVLPLVLVPTIYLVFAYLLKVKLP